MGEVPHLLGTARDVFKSEQPGRTSRTSRGDIHDDSDPAGDILQVDSVNAPQPSRRIISNTPPHRQPKLPVTNSVPARPRRPSADAGAQPDSPTNQRRGRVKPFHRAQSRSVTSLDGFSMPMELAALALPIDGDDRKRARVVHVVGADGSSVAMMHVCEGCWSQRPEIIFGPANGDTTDSDSDGPSDDRADDKAAPSSPPSQVAPDEPDHASPTSATVQVIRSPTPGPSSSSTSHQQAAQTEVPESLQEAKHAEDWNARGTAADGFYKRRARVVNNDIRSLVYYTRYPIVAPIVIDKDIVSIPTLELIHFMRGKTPVVTLSLPRVGDHVTSPRLFFARPVGIERINKAAPRLPFRVPEAWNPPARFAIHLRDTLDDVRRLADECFVGRQLIHSIHMTIPADAEDIFARLEALLGEPDSIEQPRILRRLYLYFTHLTPHELRRMLDLIGRAQISWVHFKLRVATYDRESCTLDDIVDDRKHILQNIANMVKKMVCPDSDSRTVHFWVAAGPRWSDEAVLDDSQNNHNATNSGTPIDLGQTTIVLHCVVPQLAIYDTSATSSPPWEWVREEGKLRYAIQVNNKSWLPALWARLDMLRNTSTKPDRVRYQFHLPSEPEGTYTRILWGPVVDTLLGAGPHVYLSRLDPYVRRDRYSSWTTENPVDVSYMWDPERTGLNIYKALCLHCRMEFWTGQWRVVGDCRRHCVRLFETLDQRRAGKQKASV